MSSALTWLDFSDQEQRKVLDVIKLFRQQGTVDELGVGTIRDGLADLLFPGTSTLHTRAGYLLFVPWIYQQVEASEAKSRDPWRSARNLEVRLIDELAGSEDPEGTIGINRRGQLKTFPSTIYWAALAVFRIRLYRGSQGQYHRWVSQQRGRAMRPLIDADGNAVGVSRRSWHPSPDPPPGFPRRRVVLAFLQRTPAYLRERMTGAARDGSGALNLALLHARRGLGRRGHRQARGCSRGRAMPSHLDRAPSPRGPLLARHEWRAAALQPDARREGRENARQATRTSSNACANG